MENGHSKPRPKVPLTQNRTMRRLVHEALTRLGFDPDEVHMEALRRAGADSRDYQNQAPYFWSRVAALINDPDAGLHFAEAVPARLIDEVLCLMYLSLDLRDALLHLVQFQHLLSGGFRIELQDAPRHREAHLVVDLVYPGFDTLRHQAECVVMVLIKLLKFCTDGAFRPNGLQFRHAAPESRNEHRRLFQLTPEFDCAHDRISFPAPLLDRPLPASNPDLAQVLKQHATQRLKAQDAEQFVYRVRFWIDAHLTRPDLSVDDCARDLDLSRIFLRRSLGAHNVVFQDLHDALRRQRAGDMLARGDDVAMAARACGFNNEPQFSDAFQRWFGCPPERYRQPRGRREGQGRES